MKKAAVLQGLFIPVILKFIFILTKVMIYQPGNFYIATYFIYESLEKYHSQTHLTNPLRVFANQFPYIADTQLKKIINENDH